MASGIVYSAVARPGMLLVSSQKSLGEFEQMTRTILPSLSVERNTKTSYTSNIYTYHILVEDMLIYVCVAESDFGKSIPYSFLQEVKRRFTSGSLAIRATIAAEHEFDRDFGHVLEEQMIKYSSGTETDGIGKLKNQVNEVMDVMSQNIEKVVERGERLESLLDKTNDLEVSSTQFRSTSRKVRRHMMCKNIKMWVICLVVLAVIIILIVLMATNVIPVKG